MAWRGVAWRGVVWWGGGRDWIGLDWRRAGRVTGAEPAAPSDIYTLPYDVQLPLIDNGWAPSKSIPALRPTTHIHRELI